MVSASDNNTVLLSASKEEETAGNNLSVPVIWAEDIALSLQGDPYPTATFTNPYTTTYPSDGGEVVLLPISDELGGETFAWYPQKDEGNIWQAEAVNASTYFGSGVPVTVDWVDWGDNLESVDWSVGRPVRVETILWKDLAPESTLTGYTMRHLSGKGQTELWGTNKQTYDSTQATVYSPNVQFSIQSIVTRDPAELTDVEWDPNLSLWVDRDLSDNGGVSEVGKPCVSLSTWDSVDGPGGYAAENNVSGKVVYGYNWRPNKASDYRITFSLADSPIAPNPLNTSLENAQILQSVEEGETTDSLLSAAAADESDDRGGTAVVDGAHNLTYIDVTITAGTSGGGGHGGGGHGGGHGDDDDDGETPEPPDDDPPITPPVDGGSNPPTDGGGPTIPGSPPKGQVLIGGRGRDRLFGGSLNDQIFGYGKNDHLRGYEGDDFLHGGLGHDKLYGGTGNDLEKGGAGHDLLVGLQGDDVLQGQQGADLIKGGQGKDVVKGGQEDDQIFGSLGNDLILGGLGNDTLRGDQGDDLIYGGLGSDSLDGGAGADVLAIARDIGSDIISGFEVGKDKIALLDVKFKDLVITTVGSGAAIALQDSGQLLATVIGIDSSALTSTAFTTGKVFETIARI